MFLNELYGADKGTGYFQSNIAYFQMKYQDVFLEGVSLFLVQYMSLYIAYSGFSSTLYIQRVTCNPIFSAYSADHVRIACIHVVYFQSNIRTFLDDLPLPGLFLDEIQAIFRSNSLFIFSPIFSPALFLDALVRFQFRSLAIQSKLFLVFGWICARVIIL